MEHNSFKKRAAQYLGFDDTENLNKADQRKLLAKIQKLKTSEKKAERYRNAHVDQDNK